MADIDEIMYLIDWKRSDMEQKKGVAMARDISCLTAFFLPVGPGYSKSVWDNCAIIITERSDEELEPHIDKMLFWLEDLNWPGAERIQRRLIQFKKLDVLRMCINAIVPVLDSLHKETWLRSLAELLQNEALKSSLNDDVRGTLSSLLRDNKQY